MPQCRFWGRGAVCFCAMLSALAVLCALVLLAPRVFAQTDTGTTTEPPTVEPTEQKPAEPAAKETPVADTGDTAWMLVSSAFVMFMVPGLALFYAGMVRRKNVLSSMMHSFIALGVISVQWVVVGYSIAFGPSIGGWVGNPATKFLMRGIGPDALSGTIPEYVFMMFQGMFAIITPALISGALAERVKFSAYVLFILLWGTLVYDPIAHWVWNPDGWLANLSVMEFNGEKVKGALDFAGGTVVHLASGISALIVVLCIGKRRGYPSAEMLPHNMTMTLLGAGMLWFGWFGFNAGSAVASGSLAGLAFSVTHVASASGMLGWCLVEKWHRGHPSALGAASGLVAGLVGITPAAGFVSIPASILVGAGAGIICYGGVMLKGRFGYDDALDVFGVHGVGGAWGALATGIFCTMSDKTGLLSGNVGQFVNQVIAVGAAGLYAVIVTFILVKILDAVIGFRPSDDEEQIGLDQMVHGEVGYNL